MLWLLLYRDKNIWAIFLAQYISLHAPDFQSLEEVCMSKLSPNKCETGIYIHNLTYDFKIIFVQCRLSQTSLLGLFLIHVVCFSNYLIFL